MSIADSTVDPTAEPVTGRAARLLRHIVRATDGDDGDAERGAKESDVVGAEPSSGDFDSFDIDLNGAANEYESLRGNDGVELKAWIPKSGIRVVAKRASTSAPVNQNPIHAGPSLRIEVATTAGADGMHAIAIAPHDDGGGGGDSPSVVSAGVDDNEEEEAAAAAEKELSEADADAEVWFTPDADDESVLHGPYSTAELAEWFASGEVSGNMMVQNGRQGDLVHVAAVFRARRAVPCARSEAEAGWFYYDDDDNSHGPYTLTELAAWLDDEHLDEGDSVRRSGKGGGVETSTLYAALHRHHGREGWFYRDVEDPAKLEGPFSRVQLEKWDADGHFEEGVVAASVQYTWAELCAVRAAAKAKHTAEAAGAEGGGAQARRDNATAEL